MPILTANRARVRQTDFSGGQNSGDDSGNVKENQAELLENSIITKKGRCSQRGGHERVGDNPDTLISHWTFDASSSTDDKASNDGTDTAVSYTTGKFGKAASFNGTTSKITVAANSSINVTSMGAFRLSAWIYVDSDGESDEGRIFDKFSGASTGYRLFVHGQSAGTVKLDFEVGHATTNTRVITSTTLTISTWHKVDAVYNSDKSGDIYIDGILATYSTDTTGVDAISDDSAVELVLGNNAAQTRTFDGELDDLRIYDGSFTIDDIELDKIQGITRYTVGTTIDKVYRIKNTDLQALDTDFKKWTNIDTGFTADKLTNFVQANDELFILNGTDNVHSMDSGETVTDEGNTNTDPPLTTFGEWTANNRLFLSGSLTNSERDYVWFSNALDAHTFDRTLNVFKVRSGAGGKVTWLKMFKEFELIIYKNDSIFVLQMDGTTPLTDWSVKPLSSVIGCPAGRTVADIGNDHIYLANDGVRLLSRTTFDKLRVGIISSPIQDIIDSINQDAIENSVGYFENGLYLLGVPVGTSIIPNRWMIWDSIAAIRNGDPDSAWTTIPVDVWNFSCMTSYSFGDNKRTFVGGEARALSLCYKVLSGMTDNGSTVIQNIISRELDLGDAFIRKSFDPVRFVAEGGSDGVYNYSMDINRTGFTSIDSSSLSGALQTPFVTPATTGGSEAVELSRRSKFVGTGQFARLKITNSIYNKQPTFFEFELFAKPFQGRIS